MVLMLAVIAAPPAALPGGAAAQTLQRGGYAISAAIEEALRTPFHVQTGAGGSIAPRPVGAPPASPLQEAPPTPGTASVPDFATVFWPTLLATYVTDFAAIAFLLCSGNGGCIENVPVSLALGATASVVVPAAVAGRIAGRFKSTLLGSAIGTASVSLMLAMGLDTVLILGLPAIHALATSAAALQRPSRRAP